MKIISDTHFCHMNILLYEPIRLQYARMEGCENFDQFLIDRLNEYIKKDEKVLHLGDVAFENCYKWVHKLNGKFTLIKGNHDKTKHLEYYKKAGWNIIDTQYIENNPLNKYCPDLYKFLQNKFEKKVLENTACLIKNINNKKIFFSHYPVFNDNPYDQKYEENHRLLQILFEHFKCDFNIHGHTHSYVVGDKRCINACLEINNFKPLEL